MKSPAILKDNAANALTQARSILEMEELIVFPTDTLYGLACLPHSEIALAKIYTAKHRSQAKAIPLLIGAFNQLDDFVQSIPNCARILMDALWPGKLTLILPKKPGLPNLLSPFEGIAVRMPNHPFALELLGKTGPLAVTSANISDHENHADPKEIIQELGEHIQLLINGGVLLETKPSTIVDCTQSTATVLREGAIPSETIKDILKGNESPLSY